MKDFQKIKEFFSKPLEEITNDYSPLSYATLVAKGKMDIEDAMKETGYSYVLLKSLVDKVKNSVNNIQTEVKKDESGNHLEPQFKKGDKVTYLGNPGEITGVNKEMTGAYTYNVSYDKGNGKTKATNITNKNGTDIKLAETKSVKEVISTPMDAIEFLNSNKDEIIKLVDQFKGDPISMQKAIDAFLAPHLEGASDFIVNRLKAAIGSAIAKRNIAANPKLSAAYDTLKNVKAVVKEEYTIAGRPVTLNKGKKSNGTDWTVTFLSDSSIGKKGEEIPLVDVLALIKPFPKGITMKEAKEETGVDMAKKQLDALGVKYEMSKTDKVRPFKVIYKPVNKSDEFYDKFEDIVDLFNLKGFVKSSMNETKSISDYKVGDIISFKDGEDWKVMKVKDNVGKLVVKPHNEKAKKGNVSLEIDIDADYLKKNLKEAKEEDKVDTITMDIPLFIRMLEYSREDAAADVDLHDVTEKANKLGKEKGILSMEDYDAIVGDAEEIDEAELTEANVPSNIKEFAKRKGISSLVNKVAGWAEKAGARIAGGTAIGKNYDTLVLDLDYRQQGEIRIDCDEETIELYDEPVYDFKSFQRVYIDGQDGNLEEGTEEQLSFISKARAKSSLKQYLSGKRDDGMGKFDAIVYGIDNDGNKHQIKSYNDLQNYEKFALGDNPDVAWNGKQFSSLKENIAKQIAETIKLGEGVIYEELCEKGKRYIKARQAAGEKSSAYLSGRAVKVCNGSMEWPKKGKKK